MFTVATLTITPNVYSVNIFWYIFLMTETYHHGNLRSELIAGGIKMLNRDGVAAFSLRKLSQELGVSHTAAYRHFSSKEELFLAIFQEVSGNFKNALIQSVQGTAGESQTGAGRDHRTLTRLGLGYVRFFRDHPEYVPLFSLINSANPFMESLFPGKSGAAAGAAAGGGTEDLERDEGFELFRSVAGAVRGDEEYRDLEEYEILLGFWAKVHGLALLIVAHPRMIPPERFEESLLRIMETRF